MSNLFDQAKNLASQHPDQVNQALDQAGQFAKEKTGGQFGDQIDQARAAAGEQLGLQQAAAAPEAPAAEAPAAEAPAPDAPAPEAPADQG